MKPNDKAIDAGFEASAISVNGSVFGRVSRSTMKEILDAAYAAQFKSEDYAGLVKELRKDISDPTGKMMSDWDEWRKYISAGGDGSWPRDQFEGHLDAITEIHHSAADAIEALLAERDAAIEERDYVMAEGLCSADQIRILKTDLAAVTEERDALAARLDFWISRR